MIDPFDRKLDPGPEAEDAACPVDDMSLETVDCSRCFEGID